MIFKNYLKLMKKNLNSFLIFFGVFIFLFIMFSKNTTQVKFEEVKLDILVNNLDKGERSKSLVEYLKKTQNVTEKKVSDDEAKTLIFKRKYNAYLTIYENFESNLNEGKNAASLIGDDTKPSFIFFKIDLDKFINFQKAAITSNTSDEEVMRTIENKIDVKIADSNVYNENTVHQKYLALFGILGYAILGATLSVVINVEVSFSDENIKRRLSLAPVSPLKMVLQQYLAQICISLGVSFLFLIIIKILSPDVMNHINILNTSLAVIMYGFATISIGNMLVALTSSKQVLNGLVSIVSLVVSFLSGIFIPEDILPKVVLTISKIFPTRYFLDFLKDTNTANLIKFSAIQLLFIAFFLSTGILIKRMKNRA